MKIPRLLPLLLFVLLLSCTKDDQLKLDKDNYLIFGHYYGMCFGEGCVETFKLTSTQLLEDRNDPYAGNGTFDFEQLSEEQFEIAQKLISHFPPQLLREDSQTYGCPDCSDGGGLYIEYAVDGASKSWRLDQFQHNVPEYLHPFMDKVNESISQINEQ